MAAVLVCFLISFALIVFLGPVFDARERETRARGRSAMSYASKRPLPAGRAR